MVDYSVATSATIPIGGRAVAAIGTYDTGAAADIDSITAVWKDHNSVTLATQTRTVADVTGTDINGNAVRLTDITGTGTYQADLVLGSYSPPITGYRWSLTITAVKGGQTSAPTIFYLTVVPSTVTIALDETAITAAVLRQTGFYKDTMHVAKDTNAIIPLRADIVYGIIAAYKNGVAIAVGTDYTWSMYRSNVTAIPAPAKNDHYLFTIQTRSSTSISDLVGRYTQEVVADLQPHFNTTSLLLSPTVADLIKNLTIGEIRMETTQGTALDSGPYRIASEMMREARALIRRLQRGEANIYDTAGAAVPRVSGAIVGGYNHPDGFFENRLGLLNRAEAQSGIHVSLQPYPIANLKRSPLTSG